MACLVEFTKSLLQFEFNSNGSRQAILVDLLLNHGGMDIPSLASALAIPESRIQDICDEKQFLVGEHATDLAQLFLIFFGRTFFSQFSIIKNY